MSFERSVPQGSISGKMQKKFNLTHKNTSVQASKLAEFEEDTGDEGDGSIRGETSVAGSRSIDSKQRKSSALNSAPRNGAGAEKQLAKRGHIDDGALQNPKFPAGGSKARGAKAKTPLIAKGPTGPMQRPGKQDAWSGASGKRP